MLQWCKGSMGPQPAQKLGCTRFESPPLPPNFWLNRAWAVLMYITRDGLVWIALHLLGLAWTAFDCIGFYSFGSTRIGLDWLGLAFIGSDLRGWACLCLVSIGLESFRLDSIPFAKVHFDSLDRLIRFASVCSDSLRFASLRFDSPRFGSIRLLVRFAP